MALTVLKRASPRLGQLTSPAVIYQKDIENELNLRQYLPATSPAVSPAPTSPPYSPPYSPPTTTYAPKDVCVRFAVDRALVDYGYPKTPTTRTYIPQTTWNKLVELALYYAKQYAQMPASTAGLTGLNQYQFTTYDTGAGGGGTWDWQGWPVVMQALGSALLVIGNYWQAQQLRNQYQQQTGTAIPQPSQADRERLVSMMSQQYGITQDQARQKLDMLFGSQYVPEEKKYPSWLIPAAIAGGVAFLLMRR